MIKIIPFATLEDAKEADAYAFDYLKEFDGASGGSWSGVLTNGQIFGILFDPCIEAAFPEETIAEVLESSDFYPYIEQNEQEQ